MFKSILENKYKYFGYCVVAYVVAFLAVNHQVSVYFSNKMSEALLAVLISYWLAKRTTKFDNVRLAVTPFIFIAVQFAATYLTVVAALIPLPAGEGPMLPGWTLGSAYVLFTVSMLVIKNVQRRKVALA